MKKWMVLTTLSASMFIIVIDTTVMNVSISALIEDLGTTVGGIQAAIALYALVMASFMLIGGKLADVIGKKRTFMIGVGIFGIGTFIASASQSLGMLIFGWSVIEGLGSALMMPNIQTLLREKYQGADRAFAYGIISAVAAVGAAVGPIVGGYLTTFHTWRWAFRGEVVIVLIILYLCRYIAADRAEDRKGQFDFVGALLSISGWSAIVLSVLLGQTYGFWTAKKAMVIGSYSLQPLGLSVTPVLFCIGVLLIILLFNWVDRQSRLARPALFNPALFRIDGVIAGLAVRFFQMAVTASFLFTMPLLFQLSFEFTAMETGMALIPFSFALLVAAILGARLSSRFSSKLLIQIGFVFVIAGLFLIVLTIKPGADPSELYKGILFGAGIGLIASQILNLIMSSVSADQTAEVSGLNGTFEQLGNALGVALVGTMMLGGLTSGLSARIEAYSGIEPAQKAQLITAMENSVSLVSDTQMTSAMARLDVAEDVTTVVLQTYSDARTDAFKVGMWFLIFLSTIGFLQTRRLQSKRLVT